MAAQDKEKQLKVTISFLLEMALHGFGPKRPKLGPVGGRLGWDSISAACCLCSVLLNVGHSAAVRESALSVV